MEALAALRRSQSILEHIEALATIAEQSVPIGNHRDGEKHGAFERAEIAGWRAYNRAIVMTPGHLNATQQEKLEAVLRGEIAAMRQAQAGGYCLSCDLYNCIIREMRFDSLFGKPLGLDRNPIGHDLHQYATAKAESARSDHLVSKLGRNAANAPNTAANQIHFKARAATWNKNVFRVAVGRIVDEFGLTRRELAGTVQGQWASALYDAIGLGHREDINADLTHLDQQSLVELVRKIDTAAKSFSREPSGLVRANQHLWLQGVNVLLAWPGERIKRRITWHVALTPHDNTSYMWDQAYWSSGVFQPVRPLPEHHNPAIHQAQSLGSEARLGWRAARKYGYGTPAEFELEHGRL